MGKNSKPSVFVDDPDQIVKCMGDLKTASDVNATVSKVWRLCGEVSHPLRPGTSCDRGRHLKKTLRPEKSYSKDGILEKTKHS